MHWKILFRMVMCQADIHVQRDATYLTAVYCILHPLIILQQSLLYCLCMFHNLVCQLDSELLAHTLYLFHRYASQRQSVRSATVYDADTRSEIVTDQDRAAVRSLFEKPKPNSDGSVDVYFGPTAHAEKEKWVKTIPGKGWFTYFRIYGLQLPTFNGTWKLNNIVELK